jgi:hypothetical protein
MLARLPAGDLSIKQQTSPQGEAFGRYLASVERGSPFTEGQFAVWIEAFAPELYKELALLAVRQNSGSGANEFLILGMDGDGAVAQEANSVFRDRRAVGGFTATFNADYTSELQLSLSWPGEHRQRRRLRL